MRINTEPVPIDKVSQIRIFDYLHQSNRTLKSDSNYMTHKHVYKYLNKYYPHKFFFYLTYDYSSENEVVVNKLAHQHKNVQPIPIEYYSTNAIFRNCIDWKALSKLAPDVDIIFTNQPESLFELLSFYISKGNYCPAISYYHWFPALIEEPIFANYSRTQTEKFCIEAKYFYNALLAHKGYANSQWGVDKIINGFKLLPDLGWRDKILSRFKPLYLTTDHEDIDEFKPTEKAADRDYVIIVFNHRHNAYTGFTVFFDCIRKIISMRPTLKFKIFMTAVGENDRSGKFEIPEEYFLNKDSLPWPEYVKQLWNADIQIGSHTGTNQWSLSFLDGMFANLVPLYQKGIFFDEMMDGLNITDEYGYKNEDDFIEKFIFMVENIKYFKDKNQPISDHFRKYWTWDTLIHDWCRAYQDAYDMQRITKSGDKFLGFDTADYPMPWSKAKELLNISDQRNNCTYRKTVKETQNLKEDMTNPQIVFYKKDMPIKKTVGFF